LSKALLYSIQNLSIGKSKLNWLNEKENYLDINLPFKKVNLINTLTIRNGYFAIVNDKLVFTPSYIKEKPTHIAIK
jgi:hypothetical protein